MDKSLLSDTCVVNNFSKVTACLFAFLLMSFGEQFFKLKIFKSGQYLIEWLVLFIFFTKKS